jgi:hypothetical protein
MIVPEKENMDLFQARILKKNGSLSIPDRPVSKFPLQHIFPRKACFGIPGAGIPFFTPSDD